MSKRKTKPKEHLRKIKPPLTSYRAHKTKYPPKQKPRKQYFAGGGF